MAVSTLAIYVANSVNFLVCIIALGFLLRVVWKYLIKQAINRKFLNMFYFSATMILLLNIALCFYIYIELPEEWTVVLTDDAPTNFLTVTNSLHTIFCVGLVLTMISALLNITKGLKLMAIMQSKDLDRMSKMASAEC